MSETEKFFSCVKKTITFNLEKECIVYLISKGLSIGIVFFSFISKLPQILYMYKEKAVTGLSYISIYLDIFSFLCSTLYPFHMNYPFLTYGENLILMIQNIIIFCLAWNYDINQNSDRRNMSFSFLFCSFLFAVYKDLLDERAWKIVGSASTVLSLISRLAQIFKSFKEKSTGPLSTITYGLNMGGNLARIFTTLKETKDVLLAGGYIISFFLNLTIFLQIIYYNRGKKEEKENLDDKKENEEKKEENKGEGKKKKKN